MNGTGAHGAQQHQPTQGQPQPPGGVKTGDAPLPDRMSSLSMDQGVGEGAYGNDSAAPMQ